MYCRNKNYWTSKQHKYVKNPNLDIPGPQPQPQPQHDNITNQQPPALSRRHRRQRKTTPNPPIVEVFETYNILNWIRKEMAQKDELLNLGNVQEFIT